MSTRGDTGPVYLTYLAATASGRVAMLIVLLALTRFLTPAEYGLFALVVATGEILDMVASNWVRIRFLREESGRDAPDPEQLGRSLVLLASSTALACVSAFAVATMSGLDEANGFAVAVVLYICAFSLLRLCLTLFQQQRNHGGFACVEIGRATVIVPAVLIAALWSGDYFAPSITLAGVTAVAAAAGLIWTLRRSEAPRVPRKGYRQALAFGAPVAAVAALTYALGWYDRFILNALSGTAAVGIYAAAFALARQPAALFLGAMNTYTFPRLARLQEQEGAEAVSRAQSDILVSMSAIGGLLTAGLVALAGPAAEVLFPENYASSVSRIVPWIAVGALALNLKLFVFDNSFYMTRKTGHLIGYMVPVAALAVALSVGLIAQSGVDGAAMAFALAAISALLLSFFVSNRLLPVHPDRGRLALIASATLAASACGWGCVSLLGETNTYAVLFTAGVVATTVYAAALGAARLPVVGMLTTPWSLDRNAADRAVAEGSA